MKKTLVAMTVFVLVIQMFLITEVHGDVYYDINSYDIAIVVNNDNTYDIVETIEVQFHQPQHGIFREIPLEYNGRNNKVRDLKVYNPLSNEAYTTEISKENQTLNIRIGDADIYVQNLVTYAISYTYDGGIDFDNDMDEFYFNLIGPEWDCQIDQVTFEIRMPKSFDEGRLSLTSGYMGSVDSSKIEYSVANNSITGYVKEPLQSYEALTIALPLEEGYYDGVETHVNMILFYGLFAVVAAFFIGLLGYSLKLKRRNRIVPVVTFNPPDNLNPPEVAYIFKKESLSLNDVPSLILQWASKGYLKIDEVERRGFRKGYMTFTKLKKHSGEPGNYELKLFETMFNKGDGTVVTTEELAYTFYSNLNTAVSRIKQKFSGDQEILVNKYQLWTKLYAILYLAITALGIGYITTVFLRNSFAVNYLIGLLSGLVVLVAAAVINYLKTNKPSLGTLFFVGIFSISFGIPMLIAVLANFAPVITLMQWNGPIDLTVFLLYLLLQGLTIITLMGIKVYTSYGLEISGQIEGFREFIRTAKKDQLEMLYNENPDYFYDILPYAMVMELTDVWDKHVNKMAVMPPNWYSSTSAFNSHAFTSSLNRSFASASSQPSSSSSSSGGSSGGGGGGGGGGSW